jgi:hypothetical protein
MTAVTCGNLRIEIVSNAGIVMCGGGRRRQPSAVRPR